MEQVNIVITAIVGIVLLITSLAGAVALFRVSLAKSQIEGLRGDRDDLIARNRRQEEEIEELRAGNKVRDATIKQQSEKIQMLERVVTGREQLEALATQLRLHDELVATHYKLLDGKLDKLLEVKRMSNEKP